MATDNACKVCGANPAAHKHLQHEFSTTGQLIQKVEPKKPEAPKVGVDFTLRMLLLQKNIITAEELKVTEEALRDARGHSPR